MAAFEEGRSEQSSCELPGLSGWWAVGSFGGFALSNSGQIRNVYVNAIKNITAEDASIATYEVGGLFGENSQNGSIQNAIVTGIFRIDGDTSSLKAKSVIGAVNEGDLEGIYWNVSTSDVSVAVGAGSANGTTGLTTSQMTGEAARKNMPGIDWENIWTTTPDGYPILRWQLEE